MVKKINSNILVKRIIKISFISQVSLICLIYLFTKNYIYSIIFFFAAIVSISGFLLMVKLIDRILRKGKGQGLFFLAGILKMAVITAAFYAVSRVSATSALFYILGISIIVISLMVEGVFQLCRRSSNGRT